MATNNLWNESVDVMVVGSGNGGMTAALTCYEMGIENVLVIEKGAKFGGTSSLSGGGVWIPCNRYAKAAGAEDSFEEAREYLRQTIPTGSVPEDILDTYLREAPNMLEFLHERTRVRYETLDHYPDYYTDRKGAKHGHRSLEPATLNLSDLGTEGNFLTPTHHMMYIMDRIPIKQVEAQILMGMLKGWGSIAFNLFWAYITDIKWRFKSKRSQRLTCGSAGVARLRLSMMDRNMPLYLNTQLTELITENGKVVGALVKKNGVDHRIEAHKGVILAAGGFEHNQQMREKYLPKPTNTAWTGGIHTNTGDAISAGQSLGAATRLMDGAWWCTTISVPGEPQPRLAIMEKSLPGCCVVNKAGKRISNESQNYMAYLLEFFAKHSAENPCHPSYMVFDSRFRANYIVGPLLTKATNPDWMLPKIYFEKGFLAKAETIEELAKQTGIDPAGLRETINNMNTYAKTGKDEEYQRGDSAYDQYYGDPEVKPNPCLAPIDQAPFYAMKMDPGDFGTQGGLVINSHAQVIHENGSPIPGLYACGNCTAATLPTYPGPGSTLGPAMTFGYLAAKHIAYE